MNNMQEIFQNIYKSGIWGEGSGDGSAPIYTSRYTNLLIKMMKDLEVKSVLDLGCGDWTTGFSRHFNWTGVNYTGIEVASSVVDKNSAIYSAPNIQFLQGNIVTGDLPKADLILIKDVMQHWSNASVSAFIPRLAKFKHALITNDLISAQPRKLNQDIPDGDFRPIDIMASPFNVPATELILYSNASNLPSEPLRWIKKCVYVRTV